MLESCANSLTEKLFQNCPLEESRKPVYRYGFELFLSTSASTTAILLLSAVVSHFGHAVTFLLIFMPFRFFSGGYHAKTYRNCFILTNTVYWLVVASSFGVELVPQNVRLWLLVLFTLFSAIAIFILVPIKNRNHPLSDARYKRNQLIARFLSVSTGVLICVLLFSQSDFPYSSIMSITLVAVAVMMIIPKIQERRA